jgi:hypothetical protein
MLIKSKKNVVSMRKINHSVLYSTHFSIRFLNLSFRELLDVALVRMDRFTGRLDSFILEELEFIQ